MNTRKTKRSEVVAWCSKAEQGEARPEATSLPGSLIFDSLSRWKKDPGYGWSCDHPESGWQKNLLGGRGGRVFCLLLWQTLWVANPLAVAKTDYLALSGLEVEFADKECYTISAVFKI